MIRWVVIGVFFAAAIGAFAWWRGSVLEDLPPPSAPVEVPAVAPLPVVTNRDEILKSEEDWLRQKAADAGVEFTTSTPEAPSVTSTPEKALSVFSTAEEKTATSTPTSTEVATRAAGITTSTAAVATSTSVAPVGATSTPPSLSAAGAFSTATSTPPVAGNPRKFQIDGAGFCEYNTGVSSVMLSGYPLATDAAVSGSWITTWTATQVVFVAPDSVPAGTYRATVRGVGSSGYCTASASSPLTITVP